MNFIEHIIEPNHLILAWQAAEGSGNRTRRFVGHLLRNDTEEIEFKYSLGSSDLEAAKKKGFTCYPAFRKLEKVYRKGVLDTFLRRIPPRKRSDIDKYFEMFRFRPGVDISDFALLGYSGAKLPSDGFSIIHPFDGVDGPCELLVEIAGFRHHAGMDMGIEIGAEITFQPEPENEYDEKAIKILSNGVKVGYVPKGQTDAFHHWIQNHQLSAVVEKTNGRPERPVIMIFVKVR